MPKHSEQDDALAGLLGLGTHSARKSHYPELVARLEELEAERNRYKWLFEHAVHRIFQASLQEGIRAANPALAGMLGYDSPSDALWGLTDLSHHLFVGGEEELNRIRRILSDQRGLFGYETRLRRKDGSAIDVIMNLLLKPDEDGLVEGFVADITERKLAQLRLLQLNEQLEQRVAERTVELRKARDAAEAANQSKDKYLAAASHDLLQPLNAARLLISTLRERSLPGAERNLVERAHQALEGAEDLLTDLLDISKLDQRAIKPDIEVYRLDEVLLPLVSEFQSVAESEGLGFDHYIPAYALRTGCGIEADQMQSIFLEFNQLGVQRAAERAGVGLGLAIVDRIATMLDYHIHVRSQPGRGSVFSIDVPLVAVPWESVSEAPLMMPMMGDPLPGRRLLVLDNDLSILHSMAALLGQWGCEVLVASDEAAALAALNELPPELILADYHLDQGATGWNVAQALRVHFGVPIPVVMITADRSDQCRRLLQGVGVPVLNKPVKAGKLRSILSYLLYRNEQSL